MLRLFVIFAVVVKFRLDDVALAASARPLARLWRRLFCPRGRQPGAARLRMALEHLGPIFVKFGQLLSTRRDILPEAYAQELEKLQDKAPPAPPQRIAAALQAAYGRPLLEVFSSFEQTPCGSASVAQVHRATLAEGGQEVAVKILRPGARAGINKDLKLLRLAAALAEFCLKDGERLKPRAIVEQFAAHLQEETDLLREASNCAQMGRNFANDNALVVPRVFWRWCHEQVMVMSFEAGEPVSRMKSAAANTDRRALAKSGIRLFFTQVFRDNFFHADMHPGNVHVNAQGRFVLLDYGIVGRLSDFDREYLLRNFLAFLSRDYRRVAQMHVECGWTPADTDINAFEAELRAVCEPIFSQPLRNISFGRFLLRMFQAARKFNLEVQPQLILLQKTLLNVEGMGRELDPDFNMWETAKPILEGWMKEQYSPKRAAALLRQQLPDWFALLADAPLAARRVLARANRLPAERAQTARWRKRARRWRRLAAAAAAAAVCAAALALRFYLLS